MRVGKYTLQAAATGLIIIGATLVTVAIKTSEIFRIAAFRLGIALSVIFLAISIITQNTWYIILAVLIFIVTSLIVEKHVRTEREYWDTRSREVLKPADTTKCSLFTGSTLYRLGDMVRQNNRWESDGQEYHFENFPSSIASEYMRQTNSKNNISVLEDIIRHRSTDHINLPENDTLVIHLRVGDVVENNPSSVSQILTDYTYMNNYLWSNYTPPIKHIHKKLGNIKAKLNKITFVAASHEDIDTPKSCQYITAMQQYFQNLGYHVTLRLGQEPDTDFIFLCNAKHLISSTNGGFAHLIKKVCTRIGGKVY
jgi:uncharacterized membrane protein (DUF485 family)